MVTSLQNCSHCDAEMLNFKTDWHKCGQCKKEINPILCLKYKGRCKECRLGVRIKDFYYRDPLPGEDYCWTGISFELENGLILREYSTSSFVPYAIPKF